MSAANASLIEWVGVLSSEKEELSGRLQSVEEECRERESALAEERGAWSERVLESEVGGLRASLWEAECQGEGRSERWRRLGVESQSWRVGEWKCHRRRGVVGVECGECIVD